MAEQQLPQPNVEFTFRLLTSTLSDAAGLLKLYFTLSTGAVVLFINLLVQSRTSKIVAGPLALSIVAFGAESVFCLRLLQAFVRYQTILADALSTGAPPDTVRAKMADWGKQANKYGRWLERFFWAGMALAVIFVVLFIFGR